MIRFLVASALVLSLSPAVADEAQSVTQYGITWTFDKPYNVGQFVTGDYWVVGPVTITGVSPAPGPSASSANGVVKSRYGATALIDDNRLRHGSMIVQKASDKEGFDSRPKNFDPSLTTVYPCTLQPNQSLVSTISNETFPVDALDAPLLFTAEKKGALCLNSAAILTSLDKAPPGDAFRPPYAGSDKPIYETKNLQWAILPKLQPAGTVPSWSDFERYFQRPWLDNINAWFYQFTMPNENQPTYGREWSRVTAMASLMLMFDVPQEQKQKLMIGMVQLGIDEAALAKLGDNWPGDGAHWGGRKWPILFAGLMLGDGDLQTVPPATIFEEDQQTYYGRGYAGQAVLYQMVFHTFPVPPYEEKTPDTWNPEDKKGEGYRQVGSRAWPGIALAAELMKAKALWNHDAFFDYCDRVMAKDDAYAANRGATPRPSWEGSTYDPFVDAMWAEYRPKVPDQPGGTTNTKWIWVGKDGGYQPNAKDGGNASGAKP
jgi:hypothetical protein